MRPLEEEHGSSAVRQQSFPPNVFFTMKAGFILDSPFLLFSNERHVLLDFFFF